MTWKFGGPTRHRSWPKPSGFHERLRRRKQLLFPTLQADGLTILSSTILIQAMMFTLPAGTDGLIYRAEWGPQVASGTWTGIPNSATPPQYRFHAPSGTGDRLFLRMRIVTP